jgi:hypothetical protein
LILHTSTLTCEIYKYVCFAQLTLAACPMDPHVVFRALRHMLVAKHKVLLILRHTAFLALQPCLAFKINVLLLQIQIFFEKEIVAALLTFLRLAKFIRIEKSAALKALCVWFF